MSVLKTDVVDIEDSLEDVLGEHNEEIDAAGNDKLALSIARRKLTKSVKTERSLRAKVRDLSDKVEASLSYKTDLDKANAQLEKMESDKTALSLESTLTNMGLDDTLLGKALKLISDEDYDTVKGKKVFNADRFKEENKFLFKDEVTVPDVVVPEVTDEEDSDVDEEDEEDGIEEQDVPEGKQFVRQRGGSSSGKTAPNTAKQHITSRYVAPIFTPRE